MSFQTRRDFSKLALAAIPAAGLINFLPSLRGAAAPSAMPTAPGGAKPNSKVNGVSIGMNVPYNYQGISTAADILAYTIELGVSSMELRSGPVEAFMGAPGGGGRGGGGAARGGGIAGATAEQNAAIAAATTNLAALQIAVTAAQADLAATSLRSSTANERAAKAKMLADMDLALAQGRADAVAKIQSSPGKLNAEQLTAFQQQNGAPRGGAAGGGRGGAAAAAPAGAPAAPSELAKWRASASMDKAREFRNIYEAAGVFTEIMKFDGIPTFTDDELDYAFTLARTCGARAISLEMPGNEVTKRVGAMADRHRMQVGYHNHTAPANLDEWLVAFEQSKYNGANVDIGHYVGGSVGGNRFKSPLDFISKYPERVTHIHVKDKMTEANGGANKPFGQGETPIVEVLRAIRDNKWLIQAVIEFEYQVPAGSDRTAELKKTIDYCRKALA